MSKTREEIIQFLKENADILKNDLHPFWQNQLEDLVAAGLPRGVVADSMLSIAIAYSASLIGGENIAVALRRVAARYEEMAGETRKAAARH